MTRQELNRQILSRLGALNETMPDQRFGQLLVNSNIVSAEDVLLNDTMSIFYEESDLTLGRLQKFCEKFFYEEK
jgi:hypothetical protein